MKNVWSSDYFFNLKKGDWGLRENCNTGHTSGKEYAELEWPFDLAIALVWVCFGIVFFGTIARRTIKLILVTLQQVSDGGPACEPVPP